MRKSSNPIERPLEHAALGVEDLSLLVELEADPSLLGEALGLPDDEETIRETFVKPGEGRDDGNLDSTQIYLRAAQRSKLLTPEEERHYGRLTQQGDAAARNKMIESNLRLVVNLSRRYLNRGLPLMDMIEEGNLGLIRAVEKFNPELGFRFSTYATWWIRQSIERAIMNQSRTVRLPINVMKEMNACLRAFNQLTASLDREPTLQDVAKHIDKPVRKVEKIMKLSERVAAGDAAQARESERNWVDWLADDDNPSPLEVIHQEDMMGRVTGWLDCLNPPHQEVVARRFGFLGYEPSTLPDIGKAMNMPRDLVRHLLNESMQLMKKMAKEQGFSIDSLFR